MFIKQLLIILHFQGIIGNNITSIGMNSDVPPYIEAMKDEMSPALYMNLGMQSKEFVPDDIGALVNESRRQSWWGEWTQTYWGVKKYGFSWFQRNKVCVFIQVTYKNAIKQITHYYGFRSLYTETKEYEVGYLTHEIIFRYQILLELYQMIEKRYNIDINKKSDVAPVSLMLYFYTNILEESRAIIHLCNMLHEVDKKYKFVARVSSRYKSAFADNIHSDEVKNYTLSKEKAYARYLKMKEKEQRRIRRQKKKQLKLFIKFGITTRKVDIYKTKKSKFPLHYGWSLENWPQKPW